MTAIDPIAYVRSTPPFDALSPELFDAVAGAIEVGFFPAGTWLVRTGGEPLQHLYVIRKGLVRLEHDGQTLAVLEEGETFGYTSLVTHTANLDVFVEEDLLAYRLPAAAFQRLREDPTFSQHFAEELADRLRSTLDRAPVATFRPDLSLQVHQLLRGPAVWVAAGATVGDAARTMRDERVSSVLVRVEPPGIVTDRDFRNRVLAAGRGPETPVTDVLSRPLKTVAAGAPLHDAWSTLLDAGVHHLPVTRDGEILGVLTSTDLLRSSAQGPMAVLRRVERLASRDSLPGYGGKVAEMVAALLAGGLEPIRIAGFVARLNDALLQRILRWAEEDLGPPPAPYAWIAFGSEGRMEQTLLTDQDNALVFADAGAPERAWYQAVADRAVRDLQAAGFPECAGGYMASRWVGTLSEWTAQFRSWVDSPVPQALLAASIFFDFRRVAGALELGPLEEVLATSPDRPVFLRFLARAALTFRPPPVFLLRLRGESSEIDLKAHGISPIVFLSRCYGLEAGTRARNTIERLEAAARAGALDEDAASLVSEAYRFLLGLRLRLQLRTLSEGGTPTNRVSLGRLTAIERSRVKDAFRAIRSWQERAEFHFKASF